MITASVPTMNTNTGTSATRACETAAIQATSPADVGVDPVSDREVEDDDGDRDDERDRPRDRVDDDQEPFDDRDPDRDADPALAQPAAGRLVPCSMTALRSSMAQPYQAGAVSQVRPRAESARRAASACSLPAKSP